MTRDLRAADPLEDLAAREFFGLKLGLDGIRTLLDALDHPERRFRTVHVGGTNGKGSVTAIVDRALAVAGHQSGRYTSPHLVDLTERFVIGGAAVERSRLTEAAVRFRAVADALIANGALQAEPTFFEAATAIAFDLFSRAGVEIAVCEVGLGGRLDATNVLEPAVAAITSIGLDHQRHLGLTLTDIAREKAGIIKLHTPVVVGDVPEEARRVIERVAAERQAPLVRASDGVTASPLADAAPGAGRATGQRLRLRTPARDYGEVRLALAGAHQVGNAVVAVRVLETLDGAGIAVPREAVIEGLATVCWPGRLDRRQLADDREALLDAAHNPDGALALAAFLRAEPHGFVPIVFAASADKDAAGMIAALGAVASAFVMTRASNARAARPDDLAALARRLAPGVPVSVEPDPVNAVAAAWLVSPRIVVAGSIFLLGDVLPGLGTP